MVPREPFKDLPDLGGSRIEELPAKVDPVDATVGELLVEAVLQPDGVLAEDERVDVEPEGHRGVAQLAHPVHRLQPPWRRPPRRASARVPPPPGARPGPRAAPATRAARRSRLRAPRSAACGSRRPPCSWTDPEPAAEERAPRPPAASAQDSRGGGT